MGAAVLATVASLVAGIMTASFDSLTEIERSDPGLIIKTETSPALQKELEALKAQLASLQEIPNDVKVSAKLEVFEAKITQFESQLNVINKAILQSPEKALEIPMLRRDIASLQKQYENSTESLEREIIGAYETIRWVIGSIVLGILGLAASVFLKERGE